MVPCDICVSPSVYSFVLDCTHCYQFVGHLRRCRLNFWASYSYGRLDWMKSFRRFTCSYILTLSLHCNLYLEQLILPPLVCKLAKKKQPIFWPLTCTTSSLRSLFDFAAHGFQAHLKNNLFFCLLTCTTSSLHSLFGKTGFAAISLQAY